MSYLSKFLLIISLIFSSNTASLPVPQPTIQDPRIFEVGIEEWFGTAFSVIAPSGKIYAITNAHVCGNRAVLLSNTKNTPHVNLVIKLYAQADLCVISVIAESGFRMAKTYYQGQKLHTTGYPGGYRSSSKGRLDGFIFIPQFHNYYLESDDMVSIGGSSGSPLLNDNNEVIGVVAAGYTNDDPGTFAVPLEYLQDALKDL